MKKALLIMTSLLMMLSACRETAEKVPALDLTDLDTTFRAADDFYRYADGGWMAKNPLKAEFARFGAFDALRERNIERLNELFAGMTEMNPKKGSVDQKIVDLYKQGLDSVRRNEEGCAPIMKDLELIYGAADKKELTAVLAELNKFGEGGFFGCGVDADLANSDVQVLYLSQSGLGMGDRDYYVEGADQSIKDAYRGMLEKMFAICGYDEADKRASDALAVEDALAEISWTSVENRDYTKLYNPMSSADIEAAFEGFDFTGFLAGLGIAEQEKIIVLQPSFFKGFAKYFSETDLDVLKNYLAGQFIQSNAGCLSDNMYDASFDFFSRKMSGITEQKPRWKRAMAVPNGILGEAVGQMYVAKYFPESYKKKVLALVRNLQVSLGEHIDSLDWMSDSTKAYAHDKLDAFTVKIGYPDKWKDYSTLDIDPELSYYDNLKAANAWYIADNLGKLGKATDRSEWAMTPQTVNAYYNPTTNEICFPAAILQPPFFNADADDATNYGAIGVVIGHEMTHGFDDQGRLFDKNGNMNDWWTAEDAAKFNAKTAGLVEQFDAIEIQPGLNANGKLSLGENIADQGGLRIAYTAFHNSLNGKEPAPIDGFTADQRFYLGYAHVWSQNITEEEKARLTKLDVHSLAENRVNATLRNIEDFFSAFGVVEGDKMWRPVEERVIIW